MCKPLDRFQRGFFKFRFSLTKSSLLVVVVVCAIPVWGWSVRGGGRGRLSVGLAPSQPGRDVVEGDLLDEGGAILAEVPPLEDLQRV